MREKKKMVEQVKEYSSFRRSLGYQFGGDGKELMLFARYADQVGHEGPLTTDLVVRWAKLPRNADQSYWSRRVDIVRGFAKYRFLFDSNTEIPPKNLLVSSRRRLPPHIYSDEEIAALLKEASQLTPTNGLHPRTYVTLFGLLISTGLRISEALNLSREDVNLKTEILTVKVTKFYKSRLVPLHSSTVCALRRYSKFRNSYHPGAKSNAFFLNEKGISLNYRAVLYIFMKLRQNLGWTNTDRKPPKIHHLRHTFAVRRLLKWYEEGKDLDQKILALSTYLGHAQVTDTYWYFSAVPELLSIVSEKFENFASKERGGDIQ